MKAFAEGSIGTIARMSDNNVNLGNCHAFSPFGADFDVVPSHHYRLQAQANGDTSSRDDHSMTLTAAFQLNKHCVAASM
jgi:hypothetical protein